MNIRFASKTDIPDLLSLLKQVGAVHHQLRPDIFRAGAQKYDAAAIEKLLAMPDRPVFVAEEAGRVAGYAFCILQVTENDPVLRDRKVLYLDDLCVDEALRGRGIASGLYEAVKAHAREIRCDAVTLNVWQGNAAAMKFYEKAGLRPLKMVMEDKYVK